MPEHQRFLSPLRRVPARPMAQHAPDAAPQSRALAPDPALVRAMPEATHVLRMQATIGNAAVQRLLHGRLHREPAQGNDEAGLAGEIAQDIKARGGLNIALYMINADDDPTKYENDDEFKTQGRAYAAEHMTYGLKGGKLARGVEIGISAEVTTLINDVLTEANAVLSRNPGAASGVPAAKIQTLNIFTHGGTGGLASGPKESWRKPAAFVKGLAPLLSSNPTINLYACSTAGTTKSGGPNFATAVQEMITKELQELHGDQAKASVWGHQVAGHTTYNHTLVGVGAGDDFKLNLANRLVEKAIAERGGQATDNQRADLLKAANEVIRGVFVKHHTDPKDPMHTYFRDIPLLGMDRVWRDLNAASDPTDYSDLGMSDKGAEKMVKGAAAFRASYHAKLPGFDGKATTILGVQPTPGPAPEPGPSPNPNPAPPGPNPAPPGPNPAPPGPNPAPPGPNPAPPQPTPPGPSPTPPQPVADRPLLRRGSRGPAVSDLQQQLNTRGAAPPLVVDGIFGRATAAAVRAFQAQANLAADGIVGRQTWAALGRA